MPLFDPQTFSYEQLAQLNNVPGKSLAETNTPQQLQTAGADMSSLSGTMGGNKVVPQNNSSGVSSSTSQPMSLGVFGRAMDEMRTKLSANNELVDQKKKILTQLYDRQLTPEEKATLTPSQQRAIEQGNMDLVQMEVRLINDTLQNRTQSLDSSVKYLTDLYSKELDDAETKKQNSVNTILKFAETYGSNAGAALTSLYGQDYVDQLKNSGIDINKLTQIEPKADKPASVEEYEYLKNNNLLPTNIDSYAKYQQWKATQYGTEDNNSTNENSAVQVYGSIIQAAINDGASATEATQAAVAMADSLGTNISIKDQAAMVSYAQSLLEVNSKIIPVTPATTPAKPNVSSSNNYGYNEGSAMASGLDLSSGAIANWQRSQDSFTNGIFKTLFK